MPSLLRRLTRISFRSEMLIINLLGLVNSTLDWVPFKWSSEIGSVENLPLTKESFAFNTISADRIRSILTWIVLAKVLVENLYTVSYLCNIYSVITWSRPVLLIPWILFSFCKNFILEVLIFAIGTLLALEEQLPLFLIVEFVIVKVVQFNFASYIWYLNTRMYLYLKCRDKLLQFRKGARSLSIATNGLNYSIRPRPKSLTTVMSYASMNTDGLSDSNLRIFDDPDLTPMEKAMKILNVSEQDIHEARNRKRQQLKDDSPISATHMDVPSIAVSSRLADSNREQCSSAIPSTDRGRPQEKRVEDKTASFYFLETPSELPLDVSNMPMWLERGASRARQHRTIGKDGGRAEAPEIKEDSTADLSKERSHSRTAISSLVGKPDIPVQETVDRLSVAHMDNVSSSTKVSKESDLPQKGFDTQASAEITEKPCTSLMKKKEQKYCSAKSGIGECPIAKCIIPPKKLEIDNKNVEQNNKPARDTTRNKEHDNAEKKVDPGNGQRSGELKAINSSIFFDANDESFAVKEEECDVELSPDILRSKRKLCPDKDLQFELSRKIQKIEEDSSKPSLEESETVRTAEDNTNGTERSLMSEISKSEHVVATSAQSTLSETKSSDSNTGEAPTDDIVITQNVAAVFENTLTTRKTNYADFIKSEESGQCQTELRRFKSPNTKPRKTYYSHQKYRPTFYTSPKRKAKETENRTTPLRDCRRRLQKDSNVEDSLKNNVIGIELDSQSSMSLNITIRPDRQKKGSSVLKPRSENTGPLPLTEAKCTLNYKNVTVRNPSIPAPVRSSHSINSIIESPKDKKFGNEAKKQLASSDLARAYSSAGRAARFKEIKTLRSHNEISLVENRRDLIASQQNDVDLLKTVSFTEPSGTGFVDHSDKENIYSHAPFKEAVKPIHSTFYTETMNTVPQSQNVILMNFERLDTVRSSSAAKRTEELQDAEARRRLTKFWASKEEEGESSISAVCSKKIEGQQEGKDLVRIYAKEDVRNIVVPGTSASTSKDPQIERPSHTPIIIIDKILSNENSTISENSSNVVNSVAMEPEANRDDISASVAESVEGNSSNEVLHSTVTLSAEVSSPASFDEACFDNSFHEIQNKVNDVMKTLDRLERKMVVSGAIEHTTSRENIQKKNNGEMSQAPESNNARTVNACKNDTDKSQEICDKEELEGTQIDHLQPLETLSIVIDEAENTPNKNEKLHAEIAVRPESSIETIDIEKPELSQIMNKSDTDNGSPRSAVLLEKVLGTIEYNNTDLPDTNPIEEEMQPKILKNDQLETYDKPLAGSTEEVTNEAKSIEEVKDVGKSAEEVKNEGTCGDEDAVEKIAAWIPSIEEQEELIEVVDIDNVPDPRLPITTIALFFILVINFYLSYFYKNIIKPVFTYTLSSIFLTIFSLVVRSRTSPSVPPAEVRETEEEVELPESKNANVPETKSNLLPSEGKTEVEEAADTEKALSSLPQEREPMNTDNEPTNSTNTEETTTDEDCLKMCDMNQDLKLNVLNKRVFQEYRDAREDESDVEDSFRYLKAVKSSSEISITLNDSVQMSRLNRDGQVAAQMANMIIGFHLSDSGDSMGTIRSNSAEDTASLGQGSRFEEFSEDSTSQAESQV